MPVITLKNLFDGITFIIVSDLHPINHFFGDSLIFPLAGSATHTVPAILAMKVWNISHM